MRFENIENHFFVTTEESEINETMGTVRYTREDTGETFSIARSWFTQWFMEAPTRLETITERLLAPVSDHDYSKEQFAAYHLPTDTPSSIRQKHNGETLHRDTIAGLMKLSRLLGKPFSRNGSEIHLAGMVLRATK